MRFTRAFAALMFCGAVLASGTLPGLALADDAQQGQVTMPCGRQAPASAAVGGCSPNCPHGGAANCPHLGEGTCPHAAEMKCPHAAAMKCPNCPKAAEGKCPNCPYAAEGKCSDCPYAAKGKCPQACGPDCPRGCGPGVCGAHERRGPGLRPRGWRH